MKNQDKITIITPYYPTKKDSYGGIFIYEQLRVFAEFFEKVEVIILRPLFNISRRRPFVKFSNENSQALDPKIKNVSTRVIKFLPFPKDSFLYTKLVALSLKKLRLSGCILTHTVIPAGVAIDELNIKQTIVVHGTDYRYFIKNPKQKEMMQRALNNCNNIISVSKGLKQEIESLTWKNNISVIENGIDISRNNVKKFEKSKKFKFVFVGSLIVEKGIYELVESFKKLFNKNQNIELYIIGNGIEKHNLKALLNNKPKLPIFLLGSLSNDDVIKKISEKDCLVLPSYKEGFGRVLIEMLQFGKPVISTYSGGPEYIINKSNGLLVEPKSIIELEEAMFKIIAYYKEYDKDSIRKHIMMNYNNYKQTKKIIDLISLKDNND